MGSAKDGIKAPPPQTVLSGHTEGNGAEQASATARAMRRQRDTKAFRERLRRIEDGVMALDELEPVDAGILVSGATMLNRQQSHNYVKRIFEHSPIARSIVREIDNVASINTDGYEDYRTKRRFFDKPYAYISDLRAQGAALRKATGFGVSLPKNHSVNLLDQSGRIVVTLPRGTAAALAVDARFQPGLQLLQQAHRGEAPADLAAAANAAVEAAGEGRKIGDAWLFKSDEDRAAAIQSAFTAIQQKKPGDPGRQQAFQVLALSLLAEALPHKQAHQLLMDIVPGLGNARAAEDARRSGEAALQALENGDRFGAAAHLGETVLNLIGALGGAGLSTIANKSARATVVRHAADRADRFGEYLRASSRQESALRRAEKFAQRTAGTQLDDATRKRLNEYLNTLPKVLAGNIRGRLHDAIGVAGEFYFDPILRRFDPGALSQAQANRLKIQGNMDGARIIEKKLERIRDGYKINMDFEARTVRATFDDDGVLHLDFVDKLNNSPAHAGDIKTGRYKRKQIERYEHNAGESGEKYASSPTVNSFAMYDVRPREFKLFIEEALRYKFGQNTQSITQNGGDPNMIVSNLMNILDVKSVKNISKDYVVEFLIGQVARNSSAMLNNSSGY